MTKRIKNVVIQTNTESRVKQEETKLLKRGSVSKKRKRHVKSMGGVFKGASKT